MIITDIFTSMKIYVSIEFVEEEIESFDLPEFYLNEALTPWDKIEIHPIVEIESGVCEIIYEEKESFWGVYLHQIEGGLKCVADVKSKIEADMLAELIFRCSNSRVH